MGRSSKLLDVCVLVIHFGDGEEAVVAVLLFAFDLFAFDDADESGTNGDARKGGLVHQEENVNGVAVGSLGPGKEAEIVGEAHAGGKDLFDGEDVLLLVEGELIAAAFRVFR